MSTNAQDWISADTMATAVATDPQFAAPSHPRWPAGLVTVPHGDGLLVEGAPARQTLHGKAARTLVPRAVPFLDGTRDVAALARDLDVREGIVRQLVSLLYTAGLLDDGPVDAALDREHPDSYAFMGRQIDSTRVNRSGAEAMGRLADAHVVLVGPASVAGPLERDLRVSGVGQVTAVDGESVAAPDAGTSAVEDGGAPSSPPEILPAGATVAIGVDVPGATDALAALDRACRERGMPWLRVGIDAGHVEIGPCFTHPASPCWTCFADARDAAPGGLPAPADAVLSTGLIGLQAVRWISRVGSGAPHNGVRRIAFDGLDEQWLPVARRTGCPLCAVDLGTTPREPSLALRFEEAVAFPPRELLNPKDHQHHYKPANLRLQHDVKRYRDAGTTALPTTGTEAAAAVDASSAIPLASLAQVVRYAFGRRPEPGPGGKVSRWAPTGGNLGSPNAYVVARDVEGLEPAGYFYDPAAHELVTLPGAGGTPVAVHDAQAALGLEDPPPALLVLTGAVGRVVSKYGAFAYKIVHLDAGCAIAQLRVAGPPHGIRARPMSRWADEALGEALGLTVDAEPVTAVVALTRQHQEASA